MYFLVLITQFGDYLQKIRLKNTQHKKPVQMRHYSSKSFERFGRDAITKVFRLWFIYILQGVPNEIVSLAPTMIRQHAQELQSLTLTVWASLTLHTNAWRLVASARSRRMASKVYYFNQWRKNLWPCGGQVHLACSSQRVFLTWLRTHARFDNVTRQHWHSVGTEPFLPSGKDLQFQF